MFMPEDRCATIAEADAEYAHNVGAANPDQAWILSDRDVWYRNWAYTGPAVPHPEDDELRARNEEDERAWQAEQAAA